MKSHTINMFTHLFLTPLYPPHRFGGIEKIVNHIAEEFSLLGDRLVIIAFCPIEKYVNNEAIITQEGHTSIHRIKCELTSGSINEFIAKQHDVIDLAIQILQDCSGRVIIHCHDWFMAFAALQLKFHLDAPLLAFFHGDKFTEYGGRLRGDQQQIHALQKTLAEGADTVLCYSDFMCRIVPHSTGISRSKVIKFNCGMEETIAPRDPFQRIYPPRILYLGRLAPEKDVPTLILAFFIVNKSFPSCELRIVGSGSQLTTIKHIVTKLNLNSHVTFMPFTDKQDLVDAELRASTMLVLPSVFEPFGLVVLEAIARHIPVIIADTGGPAEIIKHGITGYLFAPGCDSELAEMIMKTIQEPEAAQKMASTALEDVKRRYSWKSSVATIRRVCDQLIMKRSTEN